MNKIKRENKFCKSRRTPKWQERGWGRIVKAAYTLIEKFLALEAWP